MYGLQKPPGLTGKRWKVKTVNGRYDLREHDSADILRSIAPPFAQAFLACPLEINQQVASEERQKGWVSSCVYKCHDEKVVLVCGDYDPQNATSDDAGLRSVMRSDEK